eukprot:11874719-Alexandrium_andersonii.AAC.1
MASCRGRVGQMGRQALWFAFSAPLRGEQSQCSARATSVARACNSGSRAGLARTMLVKRRGEVGWMGWHS